ncbi:glycoside hydrolase family 2 protein [Crateriforma conspicua]|uniref:Beta-galactosidase n=1 Tax=Crateriforma conspicua TaxID=2527996 RepID=A0A5C5Y9J0_9PLAN|nr:sugar-binding domain-containing protein [Crateriforma conspicua]TWT72030.1 Beta-galactosidase [Crateriforma conspicua]
MKHPTTKNHAIVASAILCLVTSVLGPPAVAQDSKSGQPATPTMLTRWGKNVSAENAWTEYPRPQFRREDSWQCLNGHWDYAVTGREGESFPDQADGKILVPFCIESTLSGVGRLLQPNETLWYKRTFTHQPIEGKRTHLHFEAVDYQTTVFVNGQEVGQHIGSSDPFRFDVTDAVHEGDNEIVVQVIDETAPHQTLGKQTKNPKGIYYTRVSGIWQTVWLEQVPERHIAGVKMKPRLHEDTLRVLPTLAGPKIDGERMVIRVHDNGRTIATADSSLSVSLPGAKRWSPDSPHLYDITLQLTDASGNVIDQVESYAAMREFGIQRDEDGHLRLTLNGEPIFHYGPLDQGWWPDGLLTPPSDEAMRFDVDYLKQAGFNMIRKHIKVEPRRFYSHCDKVGMLVWQDMPSTGGRPEWTRMKPGPDATRWPPEETWDEARGNQFRSELKSMVEKLRNSPSVAMWVPFNERWGQHDTIGVGRFMENLDVRRPINIASGGNFFPVGDVADHHSYPHPDFPLDDARFADYVKVVGEFGGHGLVIQGHQWNPKMRNWGYGGLPKTPQEYKERYQTTLEQLAELRTQGIAAGVYTQTTDVEGEVNGLMTYDREVQKLSADELAQMHRDAGF